MNKETIKQYINELKLQREAIEQFDKDNELLISWYDKQICYLLYR